MVQEKEYIEANNVFIYFQGILRTCCLRQFGYFLSQLEGLQFSYNEEKGIFIGPTQPTATEDSQEVAMEKLVGSFAVFILVILNPESCAFANCLNPDQTAYAWGV